MLIPLFSVSLIGLVVALRRRSPAVRPAAMAFAGIVGAWLGYLAGAVVGTVLDVVLVLGFWPVLVGHLGALWTSRLTVGNRRRGLPAHV